VRAVLVMDTPQLIAALQQKAREARQQARRFDAAAAALLEPQKPQGRPVNPKRELLDALKKSGLTYAQIAAKVGVSYRYVSWVARGIKERPAVEARIRAVLATHAKGGP
jgi:predicted RecB family nuclease